MKLALLTWLNASRSRQRRSIGMRNRVSGAVIGDFLWCGVRARAPRRAYLEDADHTQFVDERIADAHGARFPRAFDEAERRIPANGAGIRGEHGQVELGLSLLHI